MLTQLSISSKKNVEGRLVVQRNQDQELSKENVHRMVIIAKYILFKNDLQHVTVKEYVVVYCHHPQTHSLMSPKS